MMILDGVLERALGAIGNRVNRVGTTSDQFRNVEINNFRRLTVEECRLLFRQSSFIQTVCTAFPEDALMLPFEVAITNSNVESSDVTEYLNNLVFVDIAQQEFLGTRAGFFEAAWNANLEGNAYLWLDIDDGLEYEEPVDFSRIKSLKGGTIFSQDRMQFVPSYFDKQSYYQVSTETGVFTVHPDRVIRWQGARLSGEMLQQNSYKNDSVIQSCYDKFVDMEMTQKSASNYLQSHSAFIYKMVGLAELATRKDEATLRSRFMRIIQSISSLGGLVIDANQEDAEFINRSYSGVDSLVNLVVDLFVASTGIPRSRLLNSSKQGAMSESGMSDQENWANRVSSYQGTTITPRLKKLLNIALAAQDSPTKGLIPYDIRYPSILNLNELQRAELYDKYSSADERYYNMGLSAETIITSRFAGTEFGNTITLGQNYMREQTTPTPIEPTQPTETEIADASEKLTFSQDEPTLTAIDYDNILALLENTPGVDE